MRFLLLSMTTSLNVAETLGLGWRRMNLTNQSVLACGEVLQFWPRGVGSR